jgi:hypothetical protein
MSVETEASYEAVLASLSERLPDVYSLGHLKSVKQSAYPLITILTDDDALERPFEDAQIVHTPYGDLGSAVAKVDGKYVVWWPSNTDADISILTDLCEFLEEDDAPGAAETAGSAPIRVVRTWSLHDPSGPAEVVTSAMLGESDHRLSCGQFPEKSWQVPSEIGSIPVQRQRPEEAGWIPDWVKS